MFFPSFGLLRPAISVSLIDPNNGQPIHPSQSAVSRIIYTDIKKGKNGSLLMVRHRSRVPAAPGDLKEETFKNDDNKEDTSNGKDNEKNDDRKKDEKKKDAGRLETKEWTAEEDAKLKELKECNTSWKNIAQEMGKPQHELKTRWKEIEGNAAHNAKKDDQAKADDKKKNEPAATSGDFTAAEDEKIKELLASNTKFNKIATELGRVCNKDFKDHLNKLKNDGSAAAPAEDEEKQVDAEKKEEPKDFTAEDDAKIRGLLASNTKYPEIAEQLGRTLDEAVKEHIKKAKDEGDTQKKEAGKKEEEKKSEKKAEKGSSKKEDGKTSERGSSNEKKEKRLEAKPALEAPSKSHSKATLKGPSEASIRRSHRSNRRDPRFTVEEWRTLQEDEMFSFGELQLLLALVTKDPDLSWLQIASVFMDKTGRRVHPEDIREKFAEIGIW